MVPTIVRTKLFAPLRNNAAVASKLLPNAFIKSMVPSLPRITLPSLPFRAKPEYDNLQLQFDDQHLDEIIAFNDSEASSIADDVATEDLYTPSFQQGDHHEPVRIGRPVPTAVMRSSTRSVKAVAQQPIVIPIVKHSVVEKAIDHTKRPKQQSVDGFSRVPRTNMVRVPTRNIPQSAANKRQAPRYKSATTLRSLDGFSIV